MKTNYTISFRAYFQYKVETWIYHFRFGLISILLIALVGFALWCNEKEPEESEFIFAATLIFISSIIGLELFLNILNLLIAFITRRFIGSHIIELSLIDQSIKIENEIKTYDIQINNIQRVSHINDLCILYYDKGKSIMIPSKVYDKITNENELTT